MTPDDRFELPPAPADETGPVKVIEARFLEARPSTDSARSTNRTASSTKFSPWTRTTAAQWT